MKLVKKLGQNDYTWEGLTLGKLLAIANALGCYIEAGYHPAVAQDVLIFLQNEKLDTLDPMA